MLELKPGELTLEQIGQARQVDFQLSLTDKASQQIQKSYDYVQQQVAQSKTIYGINTGFGAMAQVTIDKDKLGQLQSHLLLSHAVGVGEPLSDEVVRLVMLLKINSLARGHSGISPTLMHAMLAMFNAGFIPQIPGQGSVGASGDLAPLAHCFLPLIGKGAVKIGEQIIPAKKALAALGMEPLTLQPKEGLALINGTQVSTALAISALLRAKKLFASALVTGALTTDALAGSVAPFNALIHQVRGHQTQQTVAKELLQLLDGSEILNSHQNCHKVQDPYSLRCQPQVMGSVLHALQHAEDILVTEANGVTDNPLIFDRDDQVLSGGNFHAEPVAFAADYMAMAIAEIGSISERRINLMVDKNMSGLPAFLVENGGLHSGFMIAHVTAAALVSENKTLAHPASVDTIPTSANQEDHVSMATFAARRLHQMLDNVRHVISIELLAAKQALSFRAPLKSSAKLQPVLDDLSDKLAVYADDHVLADDMQIADAYIAEGRLAALVAS